MRTIPDKEKISLAKCKKILNKDGSAFSDEEILKIRNWVYAVSEVTLSFLKSRTPEERLHIEKVMVRTDFENEVLEIKNNK